jgi:hypothetical protein
LYCVRINDFDLHVFAVRHPSHLSHLDGGGVWASLCRLVSIVSLHTGFIDSASLEPRLGFDSQFSDNLKPAQHAKLDMASCICPRDVWVWEGTDPMVRDPLSTLDDVAATMQRALVELAQETSVHVMVVPHDGCKHPLLIQPRDQTQTASQQAYLYHAWEIPQCLVSRCGSRGWMQLGRCKKHVWLAKQ